MKNKRIRIFVAIIMAAGFLSIIMSVAGENSKLMARTPVVDVDAISLEEESDQKLPEPQPEPVPVALDNLSATQKPVSSASGEPVGVGGLQSGIPNRVIIPAIKVNSEVVQVGITETGIMDTPNNFVQAGWYKFGTQPGQTGSAVIGAHVDNGGSIPGVFKRLRELKSGDEVYINNQTGSQLRFKVTSAVSYLYKDVPTEVLFNQNDGKYLKLITCNGKWLPEKKTYTERLIVTAVLET